MRKKHTDQTLVLFEPGSFFMIKKVEAWTVA